MGILEKRYLAVGHMIQVKKGLATRCTVSNFRDLSFKMSCCWICFLYKGKVLLDAIVNVPIQKIYCRSEPLYKSSNLITFLCVFWQVTVTKSAFWTFGNSYWSVRHVSYPTVHCCISKKTMRMTCVEICLNLNQRSHSPVLTGLSCAGCCYYCFWPLLTH